MLIGHQVDLLYRSLSFSTGYKPNFEQLSDLFYQGARLVRIDKNGHNESMVVEDFIVDYKNNVLTGQIRSFQERELWRRIDHYASIAQVFSIFSLRMDNGPEQRGINSMQWIKRKETWRIFSLAWTEENPEMPISPAYQSTALRH